MFEPECLGLLKNISAHPWSFAECFCVCIYFRVNYFPRGHFLWHFKLRKGQIAYGKMQITDANGTFYRCLYFSRNVSCTVTACLNFCNAASASMISAFTILPLGWGFILYCYMLKAWQHWQMKKSSSFCNKLWYLNQIQVYIYNYFYTKDIKSEFWNIELTIIYICHKVTTTVTPRCFIDSIDSKIIQRNLMTPYE